MERLLEELSESFVFELNEDLEVLFLEDDNFVDLPIAFEQGVDGGDVNPDFFVIEGHKNDFG